ncbi:MAG: serine/threonine protein kinase [Pycnora praestabilis]|nr:MAG: serine/threonine protein kinase [Pycnora praestabilis]
MATPSGDAASAADDSHRSRGLTLRPNLDNRDERDVEQPATGSSAANPGHPAVRFSSVRQEISPEDNFRPITNLTPEDPRPAEQLSPEAQAELRTFSRTVHDSRLQKGRMSNFAFEPVSLPASRVQSNESTHVIRSVAPSPRPSSPASTMHSPPLTPAASRSREVKPDVASGVGAPLAKVQDGAAMTPQISPHRGTPPPTAVGKAFEDNHPPSSSTSRPSTSSGQTSTAPTSLSEGPNVVSSHPKQPPNFTLGPAGDSLPPSPGEGSPNATPGSTSGTSTPYSRPSIVPGDHNDPYARNKRPPQSRNLDGIDARFIFSGKDTRHRPGVSSAGSSAVQLPRPSSGSDLKAQDKNSSHIFGGKKDNMAHMHEEGLGKQHGSMSELKRFLRIGHKHKRAQSPSKPSTSNKSGYRTPPHHHPQASVPFADDHGLESKYGKFGKVLGSGAGGSVRLMKRSTDGTTFAVKQFRARHSYESEREYSKKVTAEFCIGSTLHHGNVIETLDIVHEQGSWYEVMEYAPYDLFAIVMTGKMSREEITCSFLQILAGVTYLHSMGLAHRDLKLDNVVVNEFGIMKLIDFGSASVFRYPFENDIVLATGVVGSDPYLAPEVYENGKYDPQAADIWSLAIIFACMSLRRFPWKMPKTSDNSFKLFVSGPSPGQETGTSGRRSSDRPRSSADTLNAAQEDRRRSAPHPQPTSQQPPAEDSSASPGPHDRQASVNYDMVPPPQPASDGGGHPQQQQPVIKGPWRLLRLLPRESRHIMGRMLELDPRKRADLDEVLDDPWVMNTQICSQVEGGKVIRAPGHEHTLEPGTAVAPTSTKK